MTARWARRLALVFLFLLAFAAALLLLPTLDLLLLDVIGRGID